MLSVETLTAAASVADVTEIYTVSMIFPPYSIVIVPLPSLMPVTSALALFVESTENNAVLWLFHITLLTLAALSELVCKTTCTASCFCINQWVFGINKINSCDTGGIAPSYTAIINLASSLISSCDNVTIVFPVFFAVTRSCCPTLLTSATEESLTSTVMPSYPCSIFFPGL